MTIVFPIVEDWNGQKSETIFGSLNVLLAALRKIFRRIEKDAYFVDNSQIMGYVKVSWKAMLLRRWRLNQEDGKYWK